LEVVKMQDLAWLLIERMLGIGLQLAPPMYREHPTMREDLP
jgi:hypothetical protein